MVCGRHCRINCDLLTLQVRVVQGKEPPCFLNLFRGRMIVHSGKREDPSSSSTAATWRMFSVRNELPGEAYLSELPVSSSCLRSRTSFLLVGLTSGIVFLWHGIKAADHTVRRAQELTVGLLTKYLILDILFSQSRPTTFFLIGFFSGVNSDHAGSSKGNYGIAIAGFFQRNALVPVTKRTSSKKKRTYELLC